MRPHVKRVEGVTALWLQVRLDAFVQSQCHASNLWKQSSTRDLPFPCALICAGEVLFNSPQIVEGRLPL